MRAFLLACCTYFVVAIPGSTLGLIWPSMRASLGQPVGSLGVLLVTGVAASVFASLTARRALSRWGPGVVVAVATLLTGAALAAESLSSTLAMVAAGSAIFGLGFGLVDSVLNSYAAGHFSARDINWVHASYGLGAVAGPLLVTGLLSSGVSWRWAYALIALSQAGVAVVLVATRRAWAQSAAAVPTAPVLAATTPAPAPTVPPTGQAGTGGGKVAASSVALSAVNVAVECGIESGAAIWGYIFLTAGRGLPHGEAGLAVAAYWAMMFVGRLALGAVADRLGPHRVLTWATAGVAGGAGLMVLPGPGAVPIAGLMVVGLAAAPIFPLFTLTTAQRVGAKDEGATTVAVSVQVAASAVGGSAVPAAMGVVISLLTARAVAPSLFVLALAMCVVYGWLRRFMLRPSPPAFASAGGDEDGQDRGAGA